MATPLALTARTDRSTDSLAALSLLPSQLAIAVAIVPFGALTAVWQRSQFAIGPSHTAQK